MTFALTPTAVQNATLLRRLANPEPPLESIEALGRELQRDPSNLRKSLKSLTAEGLIESGWVHVAEARLTEVGDRARRAIEAAETGDFGAAEAVPGAVMCRRDEIDFNPFNPRKRIDPDLIAAMAESIMAHDGFLEPPVVTYRNDQGRRILYAGERRLRGLDLLISQRRWDPTRLILCVEREPDTAMGIFEALTENGARENLTSFETAKAIAELCERSGWSARRAAMDTGACDVRTAQEYLKVFRERPDLIPEWEAGATWEKIREAVRAPKVQTDVEGDAPKPVEISPKLALAMVELAYAIHKRPAAATGFEGYTRLTGWPAGGGLSTLFEMGWVQFKRQGLTVFARIMKASSPAGAWLDANGFEGDPGRVLFDARAAVLGAGAAMRLIERADFATPELRVTSPATNGRAWEENETDAEDEAEAQPEAELPLGQPGPAREATRELTTREKLALIEIGFKAKTHGVEHMGRRWAPIAAHWKANEPQALISERLLMLQGLPGAQGWGAALTGYLPESWEANDRLQLAEVLDRVLGLQLPAEGFLTPWLNEPEPLNVVAAVDESLARADAMREKILRDAEAMERVHARAMGVARLVQNNRFGPIDEGIAPAFAACEHPLPWRLAAEDGWIDAEGREIDLFGRHDGALRALIVSILNNAAGCKVTDALDMEGGDA